MKVEIELAEERRFKVLFARDDYEPAQLNGLYVTAKALREEHEDTILDLAAEKEVGLTLLINPSRLAFALAYLLSKQDERAG